MSLLANGWADRGVEVCLITIGSTETDTYDLDPSVKRVGLDLLGGSANAFAAVFNNIRRIRELRSVIRELRPDAVVSFMTSTNVLSVLAAKPLKLPVVVSERIWPEGNPLGKAWRYLRNHAYRRAAIVVAQTRRTAEQLQREIPAAAVDVIANPVHVDSRQPMDAVAESALAWCHGYNVVVAAGRLSEQKGFDLLIHAFAPLARQQPGWRLVIFGEGPARAALDQLARSLEVSDRVLFPGFSRAIHLIMRRAQLFVLSSRHEGMPNVLAEAMACGSPCISFDCPTGPAELILHEQNGLLVPAEDVSGLGRAMDRLMRDEGLRWRLGSVGQVSIGRYSIENVLNHWDTVFARITKP